MVRLGLVNEQMQKQQGQPMWGSHYIGVSNAIYWREQKMLHKPTVRLNQQIIYLKRKLDLIVAFGLY